MSSAMVVVPTGHITHTQSIMSIRDECRRDILQRREHCRQWKHMSLNWLEQFVSVQSTTRYIIVTCLGNLFALNQEPPLAFTQPQQLQNDLGFTLMMNIHTLPRGPKDQIGLVEFNEDTTFDVTWMTHPRLGGCVETSKDVDAEQHEDGSKESTDEK